MLCDASAWSGHAAHLPELLNRLPWRLQEGWGKISLVKPSGSCWIRHECVKCRASGCSRGRPMDRAMGQLQVQKVPRWRLTIKNLQEDVEVARRRESLRSRRPDESEGEPKASLVLPVEGSSSWEMEP